MEIMHIHKLDKKFNSDRKFVFIKLKSQSLAISPISWNFFFFLKSIRFGIVSTYSVRGSQGLVREVKLYVAYEVEGTWLNKEIFLCVEELNNCLRVCS